MNCTRCEARGLWDYCDICEATLCDDCMDGGCCGHVPAISGVDENWRRREDEDNDYDEEYGA